MKNGDTEEVIKQFDAIALLPDVWDHNQQYQSYLIKNIGNTNKYILDVGCGTGELTKKLIEKGEKIIGIDISEKMIQEAKKRNADTKIEYICTTVEKYLEETDKTFDIILSIAALHHMNEKEILKKMKTKLTENGKILILDLVKEGSVIDDILSGIAMLLNPVTILIKRRRLKVTREEHDAWKDHFQYDIYLTLKEVKALVKEVLGNAKIKRHLFWRYSILYDGKMPNNVPR
jgi:2-polyprenyl-3-methyl-5-hydroxy-6-metoxy-1,4-benzoquinol methylase